MSGKPRGLYYDITGRRYGRLVVLGKGASRSGQTSWDCRCDCGSEVNVVKQSLVRGATLSCGCLMREMCSQMAKQKATHGMRQSPEYSVWSGMKRRCENPNDKRFSDYGGRGFAVRYASFQEFFDELGPRPSPRHQIDRIDNSRGYEPGNCRWATPERQQRNTRRTLLVSAFGKTAPLKDFCDERGVAYQRAWRRIRKQGWSAERALQ